MSTARILAILFSQKCLIKLLFNSDILIFVKIFFLSHVHQYTVHFKWVHNSYIIDFYSYIYKMEHCMSSIKFVQFISFKILYIALQHMLEGYIKWHCNATQDGQSSAVYACSLQVGPVLLEHN